MDFCISRIEHFKMRSVDGVFRESSRNLSSYPHSDVDASLSHLNVQLDGAVNPLLSISSQIKDLRNVHQIKGRFNVNGDNDKTLTNVMSQAFFKLTEGFISGLSYADQVQAYKDCLDWFKEKYPSIIILGAYIHFDEPGCGPHMHVNFMPIYEKEDGKKIFSTTNLFSGKAWGKEYQDSVHAWACEHFQYDFARRRPDSAGAKHLSLPELKSAYRELEAVESCLAADRPILQEIDSIDEIGEEPVFGKKWKVDFLSLDYLKTAAKHYFEGLLVIRRLRKQNEELEKKLEEARTHHFRMLKQIADLKRENQRLKYQNSILYQFIETIKRVKELDDFLRGCERSTKINER